MPEMTWFACYPEKWLGALAAMKPDVGYTYVVICLRIYEKRGPCPDPIESIANRVKMRPSHVRRIIDELCNLGKLKRTQQGHLMNEFCEHEIAEGNEIALASAKKLSRAGKKSAEKRQQIQQSDPTHLPLPLPIQSKEERQEGARGKRAPRSAMRENWELTDQDRSYAIERNFTTSQIANMMRACRDYHIRKGTLIAGERGLAATWRTWVENEIKFTRDRVQQRVGTAADPDRFLTSAERYLKKQRENGNAADEHQGSSQRKISGPLVS